MQTHNPGGVPFHPGPHFFVPLFSHQPVPLLRAPVTRRPSSSNQYKPLTPDLHHYFNVSVLDDKRVVVLPVGSVSVESFQPVYQSTSHSCTPTLETTSPEESETQETPYTGDDDDFGEDEDGEEVRSRTPSPLPENGIESAVEDGSSGYGVGVRPAMWDEDLRRRDRIGRALLESETGRVEQWLRRESDRFLKEFTDLLEETTSSNLVRLKDASAIIEAHLSTLRVLTSALTAFQGTLTEFQSQAEDANPPCSRSMGKRPSANVEVDNVELRALRKRMDALWRIVEACAEV